MRKLILGVLMCSMLVVSVSCSPYGGRQLRTVSPVTAREMLLVARHDAMPGTPEAREIDAELHALDRMERAQERMERLRKMVQEKSTDQDLGQAVRHLLEEDEQISQKP